MDVTPEQEQMETMKQIFIVKYCHDTEYKWEVQLNIPTFFSIKNMENEKRIYGILFIVKS